LQILYSNTALSLALTAATASAKHFGVKDISLFCALMLQLWGSQFQTVANFSVICVQQLRLLIGARKDNNLSSWPSLENNTKKYKKT